MHRNTYFLVSVLAVIAALLIGINVGRKVEFSQKSLAAISPTPTRDVPSTTKGDSTLSYRNTFCKVAFEYPDTLTVLENASGSAAFTGVNGSEGILLTCQKDMPLPNVSLDAIETFRVDSVSGKLYHIKTATDGASMDSLIFRHPGTKLDVFLAGTGEAFRKLISSISLLP